MLKFDLVCIGWIFWDEGTEGGWGIEVDGKTVEEEEEELGVELGITEEDKVEGTTDEIEGTRPRVEHEWRNKREKVKKVVKRKME